MRKKMIVWTVALSAILTGCSAGDVIPGNYPMERDDAKREERGKLTGEGISLFGPKTLKGEGEGGATRGVNVNSYLWRATLDTLSFMPLVSADAVGGVVITDWYEDPATPGERFKVNMLILSSKLRADAVKATTFKQKLDEKGVWRTVPVQSSSNRKLEDAVLTRAREMSIKQL